MQSTRLLSWNRLQSRPDMISARRGAGVPAATSDPTIAPAEVPATRWTSYPASSSTEIAPTRPMPLTPPPSSTRSHFLGSVIAPPPHRMDDGALPPRTPPDRPCPVSPRSGASSEWPGPPVRGVRSWAPPNPSVVTARSPAHHPAPWWAAPSHGDATARARGPRPALRGAAGGGPVPDDRQLRAGRGGLCSG